MGENRLVKAVCHPKCIVTPHVAAFSCDFEKNFFSHSVEKLRRICAALSEK